MRYALRSKTPENVINPAEADLNIMTDGMGAWFALGIKERLINLLKPTGHVMHHQFNIQQLYALPTLYLCVLYLFENKQRLVPLTA